MSFPISMDVRVPSPRIPPGEKDAESRAIVPQTVILQFFCLSRSVWRAYSTARDAVLRLEATSLLKPKIPASVARHVGLDKV